MKILDSLVVSQLHICLRDHGDLCFYKRDSGFLKSLTYSTEIVRCCDDLKAVLFLAEVLSTCIQRCHHQLVRIHLTALILKLFLVDDDLALLVEHKGYASLCSDASVTFGKCVTYITCSTVLVISKSLYDNGNTVRTISLIYSLLVAVCRIRTCCFLDSTIDSIVRHVVGFCFCDDITKLAVVCRIRAAGLYCHNDLTADDCEDLTLLGIIFLFLMFDVGKF